MLDAERLDAVAADAAEPAQGRRMAVDDGDDAAIARQRRQQILDVAEILRAATVSAKTKNVFSAPNFSSSRSIRRSYS